MGIICTVNEYVSHILPLPLPMGIYDVGIIEIIIWGHPYSIRHVECFYLSPFLAILSSKGYVVK